MNFTTKEILNLVETCSKLPNILESEQRINELIEKMQSVEEYLQRFKSLDELIHYMQQLESKAYLCKTFITTQEAADYLSITKHAIRAAVKRGELTYYAPPGKGYYYKKEDLDKWYSKFIFASHDDNQDKQSHFLDDIAVIHR